jgi:hypothetical protein
VRTRACKTHKNLPYKDCLRRSRNVYRDIAPRIQRPPVDKREQGCINMEHSAMMS